MTTEQEKKLSDAELADLETKASTATTGPWRQGEGSAILGPGRIVVLPSIEGDDRPSLLLEYDAAFIVAANPETVAALVAEVREHRAGFERLPADFRSRYSFILADPHRSFADNAWWHGARATLQALGIDPGWEMGSFIQPTDEMRERAEAAEADNAALLRVGKQVEALLADVASSKTAGQADYPLCEPVHARELLAIVRAEHPGGALLAEVKRLRAQSVPVTEDDLTALETLLTSAKQGDVWAWLERARTDVPKLLAEVRRHRAVMATTPGQVEADVETATHAVLEAELDVRLAVSRVCLLALRTGAMDERARADALKHQHLEAVMARTEEDATELRAIFEKQHQRTQQADALWRAAHGEPDVSPDLGSLIDWLVSRAGVGFTLHPEQRQMFASTLRVVEGQSTPGMYDDAIAQALRMVLALPDSDAPPPTQEQDVLTCPFCAGLGRKPDAAPRAQWKPHPDGLACPFAGHVCTPGLHLPEVPAQPVDVGALVKQVQSLPPEVAQQLWAALGVVPK